MLRNPPSAILIVAEIVAFILSGILATGFVSIFVFAGMDAHRVRMILEIVGPLINAYLAYSVFCFVRDRAVRWPQPQSRGFPVIIHTDRESN